MKHRHLVDSLRRTPAERLPSAALVDLLERGDLEAWKPVAAAIRARPHGPLADRVLTLLDTYPMYGTSPLWRAWIDRCRVRAETPARDGPSIGLAALRRRLGLTQATVAGRAGMTQSDLSKFERRSDVRLSTLRAYAHALGGRVEAVFATQDEHVELRMASPDERRSDGPRRRAKKSR